jgi:outer membrane protein assembly factor BamD
VKPITIARLVLLVAVAAGPSCGHGGRPHAAPAPEQLLARARRQFRGGDFGRAVQSFRQLIFELPPNDPALPEAHYHLAESELQSGLLVEAAQDFRRTADQFPNSPYAPVALLRAGDANMRLWRRPELDPSYGRTALAIYQELAGRYPEADATARAQLHVRRLREWFADKAYKTGLFYLKRRAYDSGIIYFKDVVASYPETPRAVDALLRLADSYRLIGYREERQETCAHLRRYYPQARGIDKACPPVGAATAPAPSPPP